MGWPRTWAGYVARVQRLGRQGFCDALNAYRARRAYGDKEHKRKTDQAAGSISPQKLYGVPVALMFFEGAGRLRAAGVTIPYLQVGDPNRIVVEAYPGVFARQLIGRRAYKSDTKKKQSDSQREIRVVHCLPRSRAALLKTYLGLRSRPRPSSPMIHPVTNSMRYSALYRRRGPGTNVLNATAHRIPSIH